MSSVVDTNVIAVANGRAEQASVECVDASIEYLSLLRDSGVVVLDDGLLMVDEYKRHATAEGQPGIGDMFLRHLLDNLGNTERCNVVHITPHDDREFEEFPDDEALRKFHRDDRKFVAAALRCEPTAEVVNAVDSDWWDFQEALSRHGVAVRFLCPEIMARDG